MYERDPSIHATRDPRAWAPMLARYRKPSGAQHSRTRDHGRATRDLMVAPSTSAKATASLQPLPRSMAAPKIRTGDDPSDKALANSAKRVGGKTAALNRPCSEGLLAAAGVARMTGLRSTCRIGGL